MKVILPFSCDNRNRTCDLHLDGDELPLPHIAKTTCIPTCRMILTPILLLAGFHNIFVLYSLCKDPLSQHG